MDGDWGRKKKREPFKNESKGAMTMVATTCRYAARMKLLMPCFKETMETMYNCTSMHIQTAERPLPGCQLMNEK
ncbi:hypothetical protein V6N13_025381 [Hibiscus sabdariffa]